jgi:SAM-dependent methyltransferase
MSIDPEELLEALRSRVEERRRDGAYPPGLEADLEAHFHRIVTSKAGRDRSRFRSRIDRLTAFSSFRTERIPTTSSLPGGSILHRMVARITRRQTEGTLDQLQQFADALLDVLDVLVDPATLDRGLEAADIASRLDAVADRLAAYERAPAGAGAGLAELSRRVEMLERSEARRRLRPWYSTSRFAEHLRENRNDPPDRFGDLARRLIDAGPVLDVGSGRGEFLAALRDVGVEATGVEADPALDQGDGLTHLAEVVDGSLGAVVLIQVMERLSAQEAAEVLLVARDKVRPGGRVLVEAVNPESVYAMSRHFSVDPSRQRPVHPAYLEFLAREAGFREVEILWRSPPPAAELLQHDPTGDEIRAANVTRLNRLLFAPQDYALIAVR